MTKVVYVSIMLVISLVATCIGFWLLWPLGGWRMIFGISLLMGGLNIVHQIQYARQQHLVDTADRAVTLAARLSER